MNKLCLSVFLFGLVLVFVESATLEDNIKILRSIDIDSVLKNDRIMKNYIDCVVGTKRCTKEGSAIKASWKDGLDKACDDCTESEKVKIKKILKFLYIERNEWYKMVANALDKDMKYQKRYNDYIQEVVNDPKITYN